MKLLGYVVTRLDQDTRWQGRRGGVTNLFRTERLAYDDIAVRTYFGKGPSKKDFRVDPVYTVDK